MGSVHPEAALTRFYFVFSFLFLNNVGMKINDVAVIAVDIAVVLVVHHSFLL